MRPRAVPRAGFLLLVTLAVSLPQVALGLDCRAWNRLDSDQQSERIVSMIDDALEGASGKKYTSVNRVRLRKCLVGQVEDIQDAFAAECQKRNRRSFDVVLQGYIYGCVP